MQSPIQTLFFRCIHSNSSSIRSTIPCVRRSWPAASSRPPALCARSITRACTARRCRWRAKHANRSPVWYVGANNGFKLPNRIQSTHAPRFSIHREHAISSATCGAATVGRLSCGSTRVRQRTTAIRRNSCTCKPLVVLMSVVCHKTPVFRVLVPIVPFSRICCAWASETSTSGSAATGRRATSGRRR